MSRPKTNLAGDGSLRSLPSERPYPLRRLFRRRFLPAFAGFAVLFLVLLAVTAKGVVETIYLEQAQRRAQTISRAAMVRQPLAWQQMLQGGLADGSIEGPIGDAVLARFDGADGGSRAVAAAQAIQIAVKQAHLPRGIGIGVRRGVVIEGAIGPEHRRDYTVIGDTVNAAARLCALAPPGVAAV